MANQKPQNDANMYPSLNVSNEVANDFQEMNSVANQWLQNAFDLGTTVPAMNTYETDNSYNMDVALPGVPKDNIKVEVQDGVLNISSEAEKTNNVKNEDGNVVRQEYSYSSFQRSVPLPSNANENDVKAKYDNGVLQLSVPKSAAQPQEVSKKVTVE